VEAWGLADEHQVGVGIPHAEDDLRAAVGEPAAGAARGLSPQLLEALDPAGRVHHQRPV